MIPIELHLVHIKNAWTAYIVKDGKTIVISEPADTRNAAIHNLERRLADEHGTRAPSRVAGVHTKPTASGMKQRRINFTD